MKKVIAFVPAWALYFIGDFISRRSFIMRFEWGYNLYNKCMTYSSDIQDWGNLKRPWKTVNNQTKNSKDNEPSTTNTQD